MKKFVLWMVLCVMAGSAPAFLLVYSGVEGGEEGVTVTGINDGFGWRADALGSWTSQDHPGYLKCSENPLSYGYLKTSVEGGYISGGDVYRSAGRTLGANAGDRLVESGYVSSPALQPYGGAGVVDQGGVLWLSVLVRQNVTGADIHFGFSNIHIPWQPSGSLSIKSERGGAWVLHEMIHGASSSSGMAPISGATDLLIVRFDLNGADSSVHLWVNPDPSLLGGADLAVETANAGLTGLLNTEISFAGLSLLMGNVAGEGDVDEVRLGETFADVTPMMDLSDSE